MHAFDVLGDPVRRGSWSSSRTVSCVGGVTAVVQAEFGISQPAVSQHLKVLRDSGFATVRPEGARRLYAVDAAPLREVDDWLTVPRASGSSASTRSRPSSPAAGGSAAGTEPDKPNKDHSMNDILREIEAVQREVGNGRIAPGRSQVSLRRTYARRSMTSGTP